MEKINSNLSKKEKIILLIYICYIILIKAIYNKWFIFNILFIVIIFITSKRRNKNRSSNFLILERLELIVRHFCMLSFFWNAIYGLLFGDIYDISLTNIFIYAFLLILFLLPFTSILKLISKISNIKITEKNELNRELPQNIEPAIIAYLMQDSISDTSDMSATLLDLVRRKYLIIEDNSSGVMQISDGIMSKKIVINKNKSISDLKEYERYLIKWLSTENSDEINMGNLREKLKKSKSSQKDFDKFEELIKKEADKIDFYQNDNKLSRFSKISEKWVKKLTILSIITAIFGGLGSIFIDTFLIDHEILILLSVIAIFIHMVCAIISIIMLDLRLPTEYLNELGKENVKKWNGFIRFLKEYTIIDTRDTEEIYLWEEYLVYAVAFGIAKKSISQMNQAYGLDFYVANK